MDLSIIIPVYNAAQYLDECLGSVFDQPGLSEDCYEVICIDDGSTDDSSTILLQWQTKRPHLKVITQPNLGVSAARNAGIAAAQGTYIGFVDCDDMVLPGAFELALNYLEQHQVDMLIYGFLEFFAQQGEVFPREMCMLEELQNKVFMFKDVSCCSTELVTPNVWRILFSRDFITAHNLRFHEDLSTSEDLAFIYEALFSHPTIALLNERLYLYRRDTQASLTHSDRGLDGHYALLYIQKYLDTQATLTDVNMRHFINLVIDVVWYALGSAATLDEFMQLFQVFAEVWSPFIGQHEALVSSSYQYRLSELREALLEASAKEADMNYAATVYLWKRYAGLRSETESLRAHAAEADSRLQGAQENAQHAHDELNRTLASRTYKAGRALLYVPSRIKRILSSNEHS